MKNNQRAKFNLGRLLQDNIVPVMFIVICIICFPMSGYSPAYLLNELVTRMGRNTFLILALLIPIMAGMGLNFGMTLGAMAGEIALILVSDWQIWGIPGIILAMIISIPISILFGIFCGNLLNRLLGTAVRRLHHHDAAAAAGRGSRCQQPASSESTPL